MICQRWCIFWSNVMIVLSLSSVRSSSQVSTPYQLYLSSMNIPSCYPASLVADNVKRTINHFLRTHATRFLVAKVLCTICIFWLVFAHRKYGMPILSNLTSLIELRVGFWAQVRASHIYYCASLTLYNWVLACLQNQLVSAKIDRSLTTFQVLHTNFTASCELKKKKRKISASWNTCTLNF